MITYVELKDITQVEANYCIVYAETASPLKTHIRLSDMEEALGKGFMHVNRSFIINLSKITKFYGNTMVVNKATGVPLGKSYREEFIRIA